MTKTLENMKSSNSMLFSFFFPLVPSIVFNEKCESKTYITRKIFAISTSCVYFPLLQRIVGFSVIFFCCISSEREKERDCVYEFKLIRLPYQHVLSPSPILTCFSDYNFYLRVVVKYTPLPEKCTMLVYLRIYFPLSSRAMLFKERAWIWVY